MRLGLRHPVVTIGAAALALGLASAIYLRREPPPSTPPISGYVVAPPTELPNVTLIDGDGAAFATSAFAGRWSLLYFGYTYCPDVCPIALAQLAALKQQLANEAAAPAVDYYLVSVDPRRDTPARLKEYVAYFDPAFRGLTGSDDALAELAQHTGSVFFVPEGQGDDGYLVSHSNNIVVLDPDGRFHAVLAPPHEPGRLASDFSTLVQRRAAAARSARRQ